jgi:hypothetical protein
MPTRHNTRLHAANERARKDKRLQKLVKRAEKRAVWGSPDAVPGTGA